MRQSLLPLLLALPLAVLAAETEQLAGSNFLPPADNRSAAMVEGIGRWLERETDHVGAKRMQAWKEALGGVSESFVAEKREQLRKMIGAVDPRVNPRLEELLPTETSSAAAHELPYTVRNARWAVFDGVHGEGLLFRPRGDARAIVIVVPDADQLPEEVQEARVLATAGCLVLVPLLVDRRDVWSGNEALQRFTNQPHREWIHRQAFELGRTLIGYEVQKILAGIDALERQPSEGRSGSRRTSPTPTPNVTDSPTSSRRAVGIIGRGEGGLLALFGGALDPRIRAAVVRGYFGPRERVFAEPIYRNIFGLLRDFGDAELAAMIAPRRLIVDSGGWPQVSGPPAPRQGRSGAAPGIIQSLPGAAISAEVSRANELLLTAKVVKGATPVTKIDHTGGEPLLSPSTPAVRAFLVALGIEGDAGLPLDNAPPIVVARELVDARQRRAVRELELFTQRLVREAERIRDETIWAKVRSGGEWEGVQRETRARLWEEVIGKLPPASLPSNPRTRMIREHTKWIGYEVVLDVFPEIFAWGWLLVPRDLREGERRPVVVCQHGLEGLPEDVVTADTATRAFGSYKAFAARLAERGFIVYAPHNPYRGGDKFRILQRRSNPLGLSLFSFIIAQHDVTTRWLATLPFVDPERIGFYGLSYGGKTAMRVPALLDRYCLSICSADFNEWIFKNVSTDARFSYMFTGEYEMPEWNLANAANYAEMAMLIAPRPFMVERGHDDGVAVDEWVGYEYAKVRRGYTKLGLPERTEIEWFDGPHTIHGVGTFDFLHKHLAWPRPK